MENFAFNDFGKCSFSESLMRERLPHPIYSKWKTAIRKEEALDRPTADAIAHAMKIWALELGATHYTHWFQPMTGSTAEKHDSFIQMDTNGNPITRFSGKALIKGEPDASSFPNGGLRSTFEARGYTYWDCSSPVFVKDGVLFIPTIFISFTGESLDKKAPLLKSIDVLSQHATRIVNIFGDRDVKQVIPMLGVEQEYFLIDREFFMRRKDLLLTGRTLMGAMPPKAQEFEDHYFGAIPSRVEKFMKEANQELWKLGIYANTEHNEAAPGQFELAPIYASCNVAVDQNHLIMDILRKVALKHNLVCLLHEKPFKGINGSGKHNNWSLVTDNGQSLFEPGDKPHENIRFLVFTCAVIEAVDKYPELLRMAASGAGNDHRLGAHEAPPAIISIFMGTLEKLLLQLENGDITPEKVEQQMENALSNLAYMPKDNADRNRTSPFAFTGNKFEFRMVGSSRSAATPNIFLNTMVADSLSRIADELENFKYKQDLREAALKLCSEIIKKHKRILFGGDGYSQEWIEEAQRRGLSNIPTFIESIKYFEREDSIELFTKHRVLSETEIKARCEILYEQYAKTLRIEVLTLIEIVEKNIIPCINQEILTFSPALQALGNSNSYYTKKLNFLNEKIEMIQKQVEILQNTFNEAWNQETSKDKCYAINEKVTKLMEELRATLDEVETHISAKNWDLPTYEEMLFNLDYEV